jgi:probable rRNA maturation factor
MIILDIANAHPGYRRRRRSVLEIVRRVLVKERCRRAELGIVFTNDRKMRSLNATYLHHNATTDVLSFPLSPTGARSLEGEIYINLDQAKRQAIEFNVSFNNEIHRLVVHGALHLLGYDDRTKNAKLRMTRKEDMFLKGLG